LKRTIATRDDLSTHSVKRLKIDSFVDAKKEACVGECKYRAYNLFSKVERMLPSIYDHLNIETSV